MGIIATDIATLSKEQSADTKKSMIRTKYDSLGMTYSSGNVDDDLLILFVNKYLFSVNNDFARTNRRLFHDHP